MEINIKLDNGWEFNYDVVSEANSIANGLDLLSNDEQIRKICGDSYSNSILNPCDIYCNSNNHRTIPITSNNPEVKSILNAYNLLWKKYTRKYSEWVELRESGRDIIRQIRTYNDSGNLFRCFNKCKLENVSKSFD